MVLKMARSVARKAIANAAFRQRIPADIKRILAALPGRCRPTGSGKDEIVISLRTADPKAFRHLGVAAGRSGKATVKCLKAIRWLLLADAVPISRGGRTAGHA
jgi:hypothetical protein